MNYMLKDYGNGNVEVLPESLNGTVFKQLAVRCSDPIMKNMTDAELADDDAKYDGDDREMKFNIFVQHNTCLRFNYNMYGLDVAFTMLQNFDDVNALPAVNKVIAAVNDYFKDKYITDISEAFYKKFEYEILERILKYDSKRIA